MPNGEFPEILGARVRRCIEIAGFRTVEDFAFEFGFNKSTLSDIIRGRKSPKVQTLARIAACLKISLSELFEDSRIDLAVREMAPRYPE